MIKHTPGPWYAANLYENEFGQEMISVGTSEAKEHHYEETICEVWNDNHPAKANSRLIAAAPELFEALKILVSDLEDYAASQRPVYAVELARAAIAKAEGRS